MNQILNSEPNMGNGNFNSNPQKKEKKSKKNYDYNNSYDYKSDSSTGSNKTVIRVFAVCVILFASGLISTGAYSYFNNQSYNNVVAEVSNDGTADITTEEQDGKVLIKVTCKKNISQLIYSWNGQKENKVQGAGKTLEKSIALPAGSNSLLIAVIDEDNGKTSIEKVFESENGVDIINPEINYEVVGSKLRLKVTDETGLDFVTYRWNDDDETKLTPEGDGKSIEKDIDTLKGENDLTIIAVDKNNNTTTTTRKIKGVNNPEIFIVLSADGSSLDVTCKHEKGIKKVEYTLNDQKYEGVFDDNPTTVQFTQALDVGYNRIVLTATSAEDTTDTFDGQTEYYPEGYNATNTATSDTNTNTNTNTNTDTNTNTNTNN